MAAYQCPAHEAKSERGFSTCRDPEEVGSNASEGVDVASKSEGKKTEKKTSFFHIAVVLCLWIVTTGKHIFPKVLVTETLLSS